MTERRLGLDSNADLLFCWCEEGRIKAVNARFTHSPSTPPILTREFFIADLRMLSRFDGYESEWWIEFEPLFLWRLHRNEPGCVVGEHIHVFFWIELWLWWWFFWLMTWLGTVRFGDMDRWSIENRKFETEPVVKLTRVGDADRWWWLLVWACGLLKKVEAVVEEAKFGDWDENGAFDVE